MDYRNICIKTEETNEISNVPCSLVQIYPSCMRVKEESIESVNQEYPGDPLVSAWSTDFIKEDPELILVPEESENFVFKSENYCPDEYDTLSITDDKETALKGCAPDSTWLTKITSKDVSIAFQETCLLGVVGDKLDILAEKSAHFIGSGNPRQALLSQEDHALHSKNNSSLKENEFNDFTCSSCKQTFLSKYNLIRHVFIHIDGVQPPSHICKMCGEVFLTSDCSRKHSLGQTGTSHREKQRSTISNKCGTLQSCEVMCAGKKPLKCDVKKKSFATAYSLRSHRSDACGESCSRSDHIKRLHTCEVCGKSFTVLYYFKRHMITHTGDRPHKCNVCGKAYTVSGSLKRHLLIHSGDRQYKCDVCGKAFTASDTLKKHVLIHSGERPHKCDVCGKSFTERSSLKKHTLVHTGERPHKCNVCGKAFTQSGSLRKHVVKHNRKNIHI